MKRKFFPNKEALGLFVILISGFVVLHFAVQFIVFGFYRANPRPSRVAMNIINLVSMAKALPEHQLRDVLKHRYHSRIRVQLRRQPLPNSLQITQLHVGKLRREILQKPYDINLSVATQNGHWLSIISRPQRLAWMHIGFAFALLLVLLMLTLLCAWVIRRLSFPVSQFNQAAAKFATDINAPPLAESGGKTVQELARAFNQLQQQTRALLHNRTQMLAAISHDLRTPITRLKMRLEQLEASKPTEKMLADIEDMEQMITSILSFARDHIRTEARSRFDLEALLESICADMVDTGFDVTYQGLDTRLPFEGRLNALKRAINNLIQNGIKYGDTVTVSLQKTTNEIQIKICDNGPGIAEEEFKNVFLPFYRPDSARTPKKGGSGLGLTVAQEIIEAHGGSITLGNRPEGGLCAVIALPH